MKNVNLQVSALVLVAAMLVSAVRVGTAFAQTETVPPAATATNPAAQAALQQFQAIRARLTELATEVQALESQLTQAAITAYKLDPSTKNPEILQAAVESLVDMMERDDFEAAYELSRIMIDSGFPNPGIYEIAGVAAINIGEIEAAEGYFAKAQDARALGMTGMRSMRQLPQLKADWAKEAPIRAAEAKADDLPRVLMKTSKGDMVIELFENEAPNAVANFVSLVDKGYYNGLDFHRVLGGFMAQGGCPTGDGTGGPGYNIPCECHQPNARKHFRGTLSMAHAGRDTGGSQFFLTFVPTPHLNGLHTVFGRVIGGMEVLRKLQRRDPSKAGAPEPDKIIEATVIRKRPHEYVPTKVGEQK